MKNTKSIVSLFLAVLMLFTLALPAFATEIRIDTEILEKQWLNTEEATRGITVNPGKTESERNFSWRCLG